MLAQSKITKLEKQLDELQKLTITRNLTMDVIKKSIQKAEDELKDVRKELRTSVIYTYSPYAVAKAYKYPAGGTSLTVSFSKSGKAISATVKRVQVNNDSIDRLILLYTKLTDYIEEHLGISSPEYGTREFEQYTLISKIVASESGFNHNFYKNI